MHGPHRRLVRRRNPHTTSSTPVVVSTVSEVFSGTTTAPNPPTPTSGGVAVPQTTSPGGGTSGLSGVKSPLTTEGGPSSQPATNLPSGFKTATTAVSNAAESQAAAAGASSNADGNFGGPTTSSSSSWPNSIDGSGGSGSASSPSSASSKPLSAGAVFAIVFFSLILGAAVLVFILRRRNMMRRQERRQRWFGVGQMLGRFSGGGEHATTDLGSRSARSSFATNTDHGHDSPAIFQALAIPPMAELRLSVNHAEVPTDMLVNIEIGSNRSSVSSSFSLAHTSKPDESSHKPMVVSPFITTESFAFPQPPTTGEVEAGIGEDGRVRSRLLTKFSTPPPIIGFPAPALTAGSSRVSSVPASPAQVPNHDTIPNPFADPHDDGDESAPSFFETVRRDFSPTLGDELAVAVGDQVAIRKVFDDGWVYVERGQEKGLIPVNCLSEAGQDLFASRRVSSYGFAM